MGGNINKSELANFSYELHISELKTELTSNVIPIGRIKHGIYYHRALLFKVLLSYDFVLWDLFVNMVSV